MLTQFRMNFELINDYLIKHKILELNVLFKKSVSFLLIEDQPFPEYDTIKLEIEKIYHFLIPRMKPEFMFGLGFRRCNMNVTLERHSREPTEMIYKLSIKLTADISGNNFQFPEQNGNNGTTHIRMEPGNTIETNL